MITILGELKDRPGKRGSDAPDVNLAKRLRGVDLG